MNKNLKNEYKIRGINPYRLKAIKKYAGKSILDVGCGNGSYVLALRGEKDIRGIDALSFESWQEAPELFTVGNAEDLKSLPDNSVETICCFETLEHLQNPGETLKECFRICSKNIIITVPNCEITQGMKKSLLIYYHWNDPTHVQFFNMDSIKQLMVDCGFRIQNSYYINPLSLLPLVMENFGMWRLRRSVFLMKVLRRVFDFLSRRKYYLTILVVGEKVIKDS